MSLQEFFNKYLIIEYWIDPEEDILILSPRRQFQEGQQIAKYSDGFLKGKCLLLKDPVDNKGCRLPLEWRPHECACARGCTEERGSHLREEIIPLWRVNKQEIETIELEEDD